MCINGSGDFCEGTDGLAVTCRTTRRVIAFVVRAYVAGQNMTPSVARASGGSHTHVQDGVSKVVRLCTRERVVATKVAMPAYADAHKALSHCSLVRVEGFPKLAGSADAGTLSHGVRCKAVFQVRSSLSSDMLVGWGVMGSCRLAVIDRSACEGRRGVAFRACDPLPFGPQLY